MGGGYEDGGNYHTGNNKQLQHCLTVPPGIEFDYGDETEEIEDLMTIKRNENFPPFKRSSKTK